MIDFKNAEYLKLMEVDPQKGAQQVETMLIPGEHVIACFKSVRDGVIFTNKRVIAFNVQGITGKKTDYTSLPYKRVQAFSIETAGLVDLDSELHLWFSSVGRVRFEFARGVDVKKLSTYIADDIL
ncbi:MAG: PH domain-containing protein [Clostridia bacterium]|nr:PH domain-containing protein [Clostridia bacterium]